MISISGYGEAVVLQQRKKIGFPSAPAAAAPAPVAGPSATTQKPARGTKIGQYTVVQIQAHMHNGKKGYVYCLDKNWIFEPTKMWSKASVDPHGEALVLAGPKYIGFL